MTKVIMRKVGVGRDARFVPDEDEAAEMIARIPDGTCLVVEARQPRSLKQMRRWWRLMAILAKNMPDVVDRNRVVVDKESVSKMVLIAVGEADTIVDLRTMTVTPQARSIAFENMEEDAFKRLWARAVFYIEANWIPIGTDKLQAEVDRFFHRDETSSLGEIVSAPRRAARLPAPSGRTAREIAA